MSRRIESEDVAHNENTQKVIRLADLNHLMMQATAAWSTDLKDRESLGVLSALVFLSKKSDRGFEIMLDDRVSVGGKIPGLTSEALKYTSQDTEGYVYLSLPAQSEFKKNHKRELDIRITDTGISIRSSQRIEAFIERKNVLAIKAK